MYFISNFLVDRKLCCAPSPLIIMFTLFYYYRLLCCLLVLNVFKQFLECYLLELYFFGFSLILLRLFHLCVFFLYSSARN